MKDRSRLSCPAAFQKKSTDPICCHFIVHGQRKLIVDFFEWFENEFNMDFEITCPGRDFDHPRSGIIDKAELYKAPGQPHYQCLFFGFKISAELGEEIFELIAEGDTPLIAQDSDKWGYCGCVFSFLQRLRPDILERMDDEIVTYFTSIMSPEKTKVAQEA